jgi:hypothetical protein
VLPPLPPLALQQRSFFAGDMVVVEAVVVDRATGLPRWRKVVQRGTDPRDAKGMKAAVDELLKDGGWVPVY